MPGLFGAVKKLRAESKWIGLLVSLSATVNLLDDTRIPEKALRAGIAEMRKSVQEQLGDSLIMELINEAVEAGRQEMTKE